MSSSSPASATWQNARLLFAREMVGGAVLGLGGGWLLALLLRRLTLEPPTAMVLALRSAWRCSAWRRSLGTSGFLAIYIAGVVTGASRAPRPARGRVLLWRASPGSRRSCCS